MRMGMLSPFGEGPYKRNQLGNKERVRPKACKEQNAFIFVIGNAVEVSVDADAGVDDVYRSLLDGLVTKEHTIAYSIGYRIGYNVGALSNIRSIILVSFSSYLFLLIFSLYKFFIQIVFLGVPKLTKFDANVGLVRGLTQN